MNEIPSSTDPLDRHDREDEFDPQLCELALADPATGSLLPTEADPEADSDADLVLDAYREGLLGCRERRDLEARLRRDPSLRRRLASRAGVALELPPAIRARVLSKVTTPKTLWQGGRWAALAALLLIAVGVVVFRPPSGLPQELSYRVEARGIATARDLATEPGPVEVFSNTVVRIVARSERTTATPVSFGLYRPEGDSLVRITPSAVMIELSGDAATLSAKASDLVVGPPGDHTFFLVVAGPGDLPDRARGARGRSGVSAEDRLAAGGRRRVHAIPLLLLPDLLDDQPMVEGSVP